MRLPLCLIVGLSLLALASACGKSSDEPGAAGSGGVETAGSSVGGGAAGEASAGAGAGAGSGSGGASAGSGAGSVSSQLLDCDPRNVVCKRAAPSCEFGSVPEVVGNCYGDCVRVDRCACSTAQQCPDPNQYTCWGKQHCGPFVR